MDEQPSFNPQDEAFIDEVVKSGRYASRSEVLEEGLHLLQEREAARARLRAQIQKGLDDADAGRVIDAEEAFDQLDAYIRNLATPQKGHRAA